MENPSNNLRTRLFSFYLVSLIILAIFFYTGVHIFMFPYATELFLLLLFVLAIVGFFIIRKITSSLMNLTSQIKRISSRNLDTHIKGIKSKDEIGELAHSFNDLLDRLSGAFKREQQFIADVAHELKTPLSTQRSSLEIALSQNRSEEEYHTILKETLVENNQISSTLKNVLDLAWTETGQDKNISRFNLSELMEDLYDIAVKMAISKGIVVKHAIKKNIFIEGVKERLAQSFLNIIDNAVKYIPNQGTISLKLEQVGHSAIVSFDDTGKGISKNDIPHIFDRFYRGEKTDKVLGSGLGLAISKSIISLHKGDIKVGHKKSLGTKFIINLPIK